MEAKDNWSIIRWYGRLARGFAMQVTLNTLLGVVGVGCDFAFIFATKRCIDIATSGGGTDSLRRAAMAIVAVMAAQVALGFARRWVPALLGVRAQNHMQMRLFRRLLQSQWGGRDSRHSGDAVNRLERDVREVVSVVTTTAPQLVSVLVRLVGAVWFLWSMDSRLAVALVVISPAFILASRVYVRRMRVINRQTRQTDSLIQSLIQECIQHHIVLKTLCRTGTMVSRLGESQSLLRRQIRQRTVYSSTSATLINIGFAAGYLVAFLWGVHGLHDQAITYGTMTAFIQLVGQIQGPFRELTQFAPMLIGGLTAGERLMELEDTPLEAQGQQDLFAHGAGLRIKDVTYTYPGKQRLIIDRLSFDFPAGSRTAILGETGAGKTTLIRLMLALLEPQSGRVELYDDSRAASVSPLTRGNMTYVPQGNTLLSGTIRENLLLGDPQATDQRMADALATACADFALSLPQGLDTPCGEGGTGLSEGQAQRLCIARALLHSAPVLLLDEATSALDPATEAQVLQNVARWMQPTQTLIFVTHRPAVVAHCTQVLEVTRA